MNSKIVLRCIALAFLTASMLSLAAGQRTVRVNLERMVQKSGVIVHATVTKIETGRDARSRLLSTSITVRVHENFYGASDSMYTFRQFGGKANGISYYPSNMVRYKVGQEVILMLYAPSKTGFQSPVGGEQGVFYIKKASDGTKKAANALSNRLLFKEMRETKVLNKLNSANQIPSGELPLTDFSQAIHSLVSIYKK